MRDSFTIEFSGDQEAVKRYIEIVQAALAAQVELDPDAKEIQDGRKTTADLAIQVSPDIDEDRAHAEREERSRPLSKREISEILSYIASVKRNEAISAQANSLLPEMIKKTLNAPTERNTYDSGSGIAGLIKGLNAHFKREGVKIRIIAIATGKSKFAPPI
jgi:hypothetical protein